MHWDNLHNPQRLPPLLALGLDSRRQLSGFEMMQINMSDSKSILTWILWQYTSLGKSSGQGWRQIGHPENQRYFLHIEDQINNSSMQLTLISSGKYLQFHLIIGEITLLNLNFL